MIKNNKNNKGGENLPSNKYKLSKYIIEVDIGEKKRLFNTKNLSLIEFELDSSFNSIKEWLDSSHFGYEDYVNLEKLKKYGIIVEKEEDDEKEAIENIMKTRNTNVFSAVFSITYKCNFNCVYCFEKSNKIMKKEMSEEVLLSSLNWCEKMIKYLNFSYISVVPFGGEPLLNFRGIMKILDYFNEKFPIPSYSLNYYISTNGSLLNEQKIDMMIKKGLNRYQITLDGLPETHNKRRSCGKDTFNIIWKNILYIIRNSGFVELLFVADMENINDFVPLIEFLNKESKREPLIKEKIRVHTSLVEPVEACMERAKQFLLGKEKEIAIKIIEGLKYAKHLGFKIYLPYYSNVCLRQLYYGFLIDPDGDVYKCYGAGGDKRYKIGSIDTPIDKILESARKWADMDVWDKECLNCQIFPLCRGAFCQHQAAQFFDGEYGHKFCNKELDIFFIKESIKHLY